MELAIISDLHLGAGSSVLVLGKPGSGQGWKIDPIAISALRQAVLLERTKIDTLVLLGDVFDLSLASFEEAWDAAKAFFDAIYDWTDRIVYVPGNHDFTMWHYFEQQVHVTSRTMANPPQLPRGFRFAVPGVVHQGQVAQRGAIYLAGVGEDQGAEKYIGGFFQGLWKGENKEFLVAYPNLYVLDESSQCSLLTHGQYFDGFWNILGQASLQCAAPDLSTTQKGKINICELVQLNYPTSILNASAIGQAGLFATLARQVHDDITLEQYARPQRLFNALFDFIRKRLAFSGMAGFFKGMAVRFCLSRFQASAAEQIFVKKSIPTARFNRDYVKNNFTSIQNYILLCQQEINSLIPQQQTPINRLIFGHTHEPSQPNGQENITISSNQSVVCRNTGGWVIGPNNSFAATVAHFKDHQWSMVPISRTNFPNPIVVGKPFSI